MPTELLCQAAALPWFGAVGPGPGAVPCTEPVLSQPVLKGQGRVPGTGGAAVPTGPPACGTAALVGDQPQTGDHMA